MVRSAALVSNIGEHQHWRFESSQKRSCLIIVQRSIPQHTIALQVWSRFESALSKLLKFRSQSNETFSNWCMKTCILIFQFRQWILKTWNYTTQNHFKSFSKSDSPAFKVWSRSERALTSYCRETNLFVKIKKNKIYTAEKKWKHHRLKFEANQKTHSPAIACKPTISDL